MTKSTEELKDKDALWDMLAIKHKDKINEKYNLSTNVLAIG